jgi:hypothetical protein
MLAVSPRIFILKGAEMSKTNPVVTIELGGKLRHLKLTLNAMVSFEEVTGKSIMGADTKSVISMGATGLRALIWVCLLHEEPELKIEEVGSWIDTGNVTDIAEQLGKAINEAMPEVGEVADKDPLPPEKK